MKVLVISILWPRVRDEKRILEVWEVWGRRSVKAGFAKAEQMGWLGKKIPGLYEQTCPQGSQTFSKVSQTYLFIIISKVQMHFLLV